MRGAPAVDFPVGAERLSLRLHQAVASCMLGLLALWCVQSHPPTGLAFAAWAFALVLAGGSLWHAGRAAPGQAGRLQWNGRMWTLRGGASGQGVTPINVTVVWDLQHALLLYLRGAGTRGGWIWVVHGANTSCWLALRRALMQDGAARVTGALRGRHG